MFLDQLTSFEGTHLLPWSTIKSTFAVLAKPKPKWIKLLESVLISSTSRCLSSHLQSASRDITTYMPDPNCPDISRSTREWFAMWHPPSNSTIMGQIRKKNVTSNTIVGQHYIEWLDTSLSLSTPHTSLPILIQCQGCALDDASIILPEQHAQLVYLPVM